MEKDRKTYPLEGKKVVITRAREQSKDFTSLLVKEKAIPIIFPVIEFVPCNVDSGEIQKLRAEIGNFHWIIFTSANGVVFFMKLLKDLGIPFPKGVKVAAIGPATKRKAQEYGLYVDLIPESYVAEGLLEVLKEVEGKRILIPRAKVAREILPDTLKRRGAYVWVLPVYETVLPSKKPEELQALEDAHVITFTSPSTVKNFFRILGEKARGVCEGKVIASIGPVTTAEILKYGFEVDVEAREFSVAGLVQALKEFFTSESSHLR